MYGTIEQARQAVLEALEESGYSASSQDIAELTQETYDFDSESGSYTQTASYEEFWESASNYDLKVLA